jgi:hypothetical protein
MLGRQELRKLHAVMNEARRPSPRRCLRSNLASGA